MDIERTTIRKVLTRTSGYLTTVTSHSLQPYCGCTLGSSLCGVGCYVRHNRMLTRGREWGTFLEARENAAESYLEHVERERAWARRSPAGEFSIFLSSSTEPFLPQEARLGVTARVLEAMTTEPPDSLVVQTHSHRVTGALDRLRDLSSRTRLRVHVSIETDRERIEGLPPHGSPVERRFEAVQELREAGIPVVVTVSPLLPIRDPERFFARIAGAADAVVLDHFIGGDGSPDGRRTRATPLPIAMESVEPGSSTLAYRRRMIEIAWRHQPGRVGVGIDGFAGRYLSRPDELEEPEASD